MVHDQLMSPLSCRNGSNVAPKAWVCYLQSIQRQLNGSDLTKHPFHLEPRLEVNCKVPNAPHLFSQEHRDKAAKDLDMIVPTICWRTKRPAGALLCGSVCRRGVGQDTKTAATGSNRS